MKRLLMILAAVLSACGGSEASYRLLQETGHGTGSGTELETDSNGNCVPEEPQRPTPDLWIDREQGRVHMQMSVMVIRSRPVGDDTKPASGVEHLAENQVLNVEAQSGRDQGDLRRATRSGERKQQEASFRSLEEARDSLRHDVEVEAQRLAGINADLHGTLSHLTGNVNRAAATHNAAVRGDPAPGSLVSPDSHELLPGGFRTDPYSAHGLEVREVAAYVAYAKSAGASPFDSTTTGILSTAASRAVREGDAAYAAGNVAAGRFAMEVAVTIADTLLGFVPGVGWAKDVIEAVTGRNLLTGESLSTTDRAIAILGAATLGIGSKIKAVKNASNIIAKVSKAPVEAIAHADKLYARAMRIGLKPDQVAAHADVVARFDDSYRVERIIKGKEANVGFGEPPYPDDSVVIEFVTTKDEVFARTHGPSNQVGRWMARASDLAGKTPEEIKEFLVLKDVPTHSSEVHVPSGTRIRTGIAGKNGFGSGRGAVQYQLMEKLPEGNYPQ